MSQRLGPQVGYRPDSHSTDDAQAAREAGRAQAVGCRAGGAITQYAAVMIDVADTTTFVGDTVIEAVAASAAIQTKFLGVAQHAAADEDEDVLVVCGKGQITMVQCEVSTGFSAGDPLTVHTVAPELALGVVGTDHIVAIALEDDGATLADHALVMLL